MDRELVLHSKAISYVHPPTCGLLSAVARSSLLLERDLLVESQHPLIIKLHFAFSTEQRSVVH